MKKIIEAIFLTILLLKGLEINAQINKALVLDGCNNFFEIYDEQPLDYDQEISIECWVLPNCDNGNNVIVSKEWCSGQFGYYLSLNDKRLFWSYSSNGLCTSPNNIRSVNQVIPTNQFSHIAVVHSSSEIKLFVNGLEVITEYVQGTFGPIFNSSEPFRIGAYKNNSGGMSNFYSGLIDEIRVWNFELNEALIQQRMSIQLNGDEPDLILYLDMENDGQGSGLVLENQSIVGSSLNAIPIGIGQTTPYTIGFEEYTFNILNLNEELSVCTFPVLVSIPNNVTYKNITWNNGTNGTDINITNPGKFSVIVEVEKCKYYYDTITINEIPVIQNEEFFFLCENESVEINGTIYDTDGSYQQTLTSSQGCDSILNIEIILNNQLIYIPNIFSSSSIQNQVFQPFFASDSFTQYNMLIYDRWGNEIFSGQNNSWDGKFNDKYVEQGVYTYLIYTDESCLKNPIVGSVTFIK